MYPEFVDVWEPNYPMLFALMALMLLVILVLAESLRRARRDTRTLQGGLKNASTVIFEGVNGPLKKALGVTGAATISEAQKVVDAIELYLGPVLILGAFYGGPLKGLKDAIAGKMPKDDKKKDDGHGKGGGHGRGHGVSLGAGNGLVHAAVPGDSAVILTPTQGIVGLPPVSDAAASAGGGVAVASASTEAGGVSVMSPAYVFSVQTKPVADGHGHGHDSHAEPAGPTLREQVAITREALEKLSDHWQPATVKQALENAQKALLISRSLTPAPSPFGPRPGAGGGERSLLDQLYGRPAR